MFSTFEEMTKGQCGWSSERGGEELGVMKMMKRWAGAWNHVKHFLLFASNNWDLVSSFKLGSDMIRLAFLQ